MTVNSQEIPLTPGSQTLSIKINGVTYNLAVTWRATGYILDIYDSTSTPLVTGLSLVTGCDLLEQFSYLNFPMKLIIASDIDPSFVPGYNDLGINSHLCVVTVV